MSFKAGMKLYGTSITLMLEHKNTPQQIVKNDWIAVFYKVIYPSNYNHNL